MGQLRWGTCSFEYNIVPKIVKGEGANGRLLRILCILVNLALLVQAGRGRHGRGGAGEARGEAERGEGGGAAAAEQLGAGRGGAGRPRGGAAGVGPGGRQPAPGARVQEQERAAGRAVSPPARLGVRPRLDLARHRGRVHQTWAGTTLGLRLTT